MNNVYETQKPIISEDCKKINITPTSLYLLYLFILCPLLYDKFSNYLIVGIILITWFSTFILMFNFKIKKSYTIVGFKPIIVWFLIFLFWQIIILVLKEINIESLIRIIQSFTCFFTFVLSFFIGIKKNDLKILKFGIYLILFSCAIKWGIDGFQIRDYSFFMNNANTFSEFIFVWTLILMIPTGTEKSKINFIAIIVCFILSIIASSRINILAILLLFIFNFYFNHKKETNKINNKIVFIYILEFVFLSIFVVLYISLSKNSIGSTLQEYSRKFFHKNFFSGREILWSALLECIKENPLTGLGLNIIPSDVINNTTLSSHNLFLQIGIQMGIIGIVSIFMIFKNIIKLCSKSENNISILISCFCLGIILIEFFEVTITQNLLISGIEKWFILGYGCKEAYNSIRQNYEQI